MGRGLGGHRQARGLGPADKFNAAGGADMGDMQAAAGEARQGKIPEDHDLFDGGGDALQSQFQGDPAFVHDACAPKFQVLGVGDDRQAEGAGVLQGPAHEHGTQHRPAVVGDGHGPGLLLIAVLAQLLALRAHGDGRHRIDPGQTRGLRPAPG